MFLLSNLHSIFLLHFPLLLRLTHSPPSPLLGLTYFPVAILPEYTTQSTDSYESFNRKLVSHPSGSNTSGSRHTFPSLDNGLFYRVESMGTMQLEM